MVVLVWVDEHTPESARAGTLRTDGVESFVQSVVDGVTAPRPPGRPAAGDPPWGTYLGVDPDSGQVVGTCGFREPPSSGRVEIAFWTFPPFEGRGWATAMTRELLALAQEHPEIRTVLAHTMPERDPAGSVLKAAGLRHVGAVRRDVPADGGGAAVKGQVWRWELRRRANR